MNKVNVGIDISKKKFDVCMLFPKGKTLNRVFKNDPEGFAAFLNFLDQKDSVCCRVAMESTGWYGEDLVAVGTALSSSPPHRWECLVNCVSFDRSKYNTLKGLTNATRKRKNNI